MIDISVERGPRKRRGRMDLPPIECDLEPAMPQFKCPAFVRNGKPDHEGAKHLLASRRVFMNGKVATLRVDDNVCKRGRERTVRGQLPLHDLEDARRVRVEAIHDDLFTPTNAQAMAHPRVRAGSFPVTEWRGFRAVQQRPDEPFVPPVPEDESLARGKHERQ